MQPLPPQSGATPAPVEPPDQLPVWPWYVAYCVFMALVYLGCIGLGVLMLMVDPGDMDMDPIEAIITAVIFILVSLPLMVGFAAAPVLPRRGWAWIVGLLLIGLGMTSCCCMPICLPLLLQWVKPETKAWFGYVGG